MDPQQVITISAKYPPVRSEPIASTLKNVPLAMAALMKWHLERDGISATGQPRVDRAPAGRVLETLGEKSTSLVDLLEYMNKRSDNYLAESMFRKLSTIAQVAAYSPDDRTRELMRSWLKVCNVNGTACTFIDGSGLSKEDRVTANTGGRSARGDSPAWDVPALYSHSLCSRLRWHASPSHGWHIRTIQRPRKNGNA